MHYYYLESFVRWLQVWSVRRGWTAWDLQDTAVYPYFFVSFSTFRVWIMIVTTDDGNDKLAFPAQRLRASVESTKARKYQVQAAGCESAPQGRYQ